jgi:peptide/nickel transport system substrate-binding protein
MTLQGNGGWPVSRRTLLRLAASAGGLAALPAFAADNGFIVVNAKYDALYQRTGTYYTKDPQWITWTRPRLTWPQAGENVPELTVVIPTVQTNWLDAWRKFAADAGKLGLKYNLQQVSEARWLDVIGLHTHGDIEVHSAILRPERVDPAEWLTSRAYGLDRRNYGEWVNQQYDALIEAQVAESDPARRLKLVQDAQRILADDL